MIDPYPSQLMETDLTPTTEPDPLVRAINRLAQAIEQQVLATLDRPVAQQNAPQAPAQARPALAPLPAVTVVAQKPPCPAHGIEKVQSSTKFPGFFCTAKDPNGPRGYCAWNVRTA
jgi:hypothetical protein